MEVDREKHGRTHALNLPGSERGFAQVSLELVHASLARAAAYLFSFFYFSIN